MGYDIHGSIFRFEKAFQFGGKLDEAVAGVVWAVVEGDFLGGLRAAGHFDLFCNGLVVERVDGD